MARLVTQLRRSPSTGGEVLEMVGSTPPTAFISLLLVPEGRVDSETPVIREVACQVPDVADSCRLRITEGLESCGPLVGT